MSSYRTLFEIGKALFKETEIDKLLPLALDILIERTEAERGIILVYGEENKLLFQAGQNDEKKNIEQPEMKVPKFIVQQARQTKRSVFSPDAFKDPQFDPSKSVSSLHVRSVVCAPLKFEGEAGISGVIYLDHREREALFKDDTKRLLRKLAAFVSLAVQNALEKRQLLEHQQKLQDELEGYGDIIGRSQAMQEIYKRIEKVAVTDATVLITGESGTGKELIARALHRKSSRCNPKPVALNCAELASGLLESELFGIEEKTATGVKKHIGLIEQASGGTLFIDEVGDIPLSIQVRLLRVLQERSLRRVGGDTEIPVDVRIVAATNRDLRTLIKQGQFREDLFYRLNVIPIELPPLRDRGDDIILLAEHFLKQWAHRFNRPIVNFSPEARKLLSRHRFPGNVRELDNIIQRTVALKDGPIIEAEDLLFDKKVDPPPESSYDFAFNEWEYGYLVKLIEKTGGNVTKAADLAGIHITTLHRKLKLHKIDSQRFK